jgi:hypothetical protein
MIAPILRLRVLVGVEGFAVVVECGTLGRFLALFIFRCRLCGTEALYSIFFRNATRRRNP